MRQSNPREILGSGVHGKRPGRGRLLLLQDSLPSLPRKHLLSPTSTQPWKAWIPALIWLGVIVLESTNLGSSQNTSRILFPLFHFLTGVDLPHFMVWNHHMRKAGHILGYFVLSLLLFRAWRATLPYVSASLWSFRWARISFIMTALVASLDEWHQTFLPSRTGRWQDVVLDSTAALAAQVVIWVFVWRRHSSTADA
jgi:VanZ family protein